MTTATQPARRTLRFAVLTDILNDLDRLIAGPYVTVGKWSAGQIFEHLARTIDGCFDGFHFTAPWWLRVFIAPFIKNSMFTAPMKAGFKLPDRAKDLMPPDEVDAEEGLEHLRRSIGRFSSELPRHPSPVFGELTREEWVAMTLRHCELHLSFIVPEGR